jgi:hypothetical protein
MQLQTLSFKRTLNRAYRLLKPSREEINLFKTNLIRLLDRIDLEESEENVKGHLRDFFNDTWYKDQHLISTKGRTDLVIHEERSAQSKPAVLFEVKRPKNTADMISSSNFNTKALHELVLYYLRERIEENNTDIKYLIVTNIYEWYFFDATIFDRYFFQNKKLIKEYEDWKNGRKAQNTTDFFYRDIAKPFIANLELEISAAYLDLREFNAPLRNASEQDDRSLIPLFKIFSPAHLLKQPFANDSNSLDKHFYNELLHLLGLEEYKEGGKKIIRRCSLERRLPGSLLENAINTIQYEERLPKVKNLNSYGSSREEQTFGVALELVITWVNRILFLKLLESQLLKYHGGEEQYRFLAGKTIHDYDALNLLFFQVLAEKPEQRRAAIRATYAHVPYLNSSLFEITELESDTIRINSLEDDVALPLHHNTVLKESTGKPLKGNLVTLHYLLEFLDAYDFASTGAEEIQENNKTLINASVLGLIFEKINGYRDGSFFTPGFITMYMSRETVHRAVIERFNREYSFTCQDIGDLSNHLTGRNKADILNYNRTFNSLRICDPAVGSGHFLVSALNELIALKSELGILADADGVLLRNYEARVDNDELIVSCNEGADLYEYKLREGRAERETQRVQETLFHEKQNLIESCLFGVDINPNSVKICRLRLWIELLKNTYYHGGTVTGGLETLPNIDINIKTGNSLINRFALDADLKPLLKKGKWNLQDYRLAISSYQHATDKTEKRSLITLVDSIKNDFQSHFSLNDPKRKQLAKLRGQIDLVRNKTQVGDLFEKLKEADITEDLQKLEKGFQKLNAEIEEIQHNKIYENAFEWRFEFPEVLNEDGDFVGFDAIIGNPPYIRQEEFSALKPYLQSQYATYAGTADLLVYFIELGIKLLRPAGLFNFIISNKFMRANFGKPLRQWLQQYRLLEILDFGDLPVFEEATTYPCILQIQKQAPAAYFRAANVPALEQGDFAAYAQGLYFQSAQNALTPEGWTLADTRVQQLLEKLKRTGIPLGEYVQGKIYYGIKTGLNEAFVIDAPTRERLIAEDARSAEVIKPFLAGRDVKRYVAPNAKNYVLFIPWHFPLHMDSSISGVSKESEQLFSQNYPAVYAHLLQFKEKLEARNKQETGIRYEWYALQRYASSYFEEFEKPKIIYPNILKQPEFTFDSSSFYTNQKCFIISVEDYFLLGYLNSSLMYFLFKENLPMLRGGFFEPSSIFFTKFPVPDAPSEIKAKVEALVKTILETKTLNRNADVTDIELEIDRIVYQLFELEEKEIEIING